MIIKKPKAHIKNRKYNFLYCKFSFIIGFKSNTLLIHKQKLHLNSNLMVFHISNFKEVNDKENKEINGVS